MTDRQREREQRQEAWGDAVYAAWRRGLDSDRVDRDRMDDDSYAGHGPEECVERELKRITPKQLEAEDGEMDEVDP